jgi:autotransporter passenger strand-loop-strand repeat protein
MFFGSAGCLPTNVIGGYGERDHHQRRHELRDRGRHGDHAQLVARVENVFGTAISAVIGGGPQNVEAGGVASAALLSAGIEDVASGALAPLRAAPPSAAASNM